MPSRFILASVAGPDAVELADRQGFDEGRALLRRDDELAVGLAVIGRQLGQELVVGDAGRGGEAGLGEDAGADLAGDVGGERHVLEVGRDVEIGLVERQRLDQRRVLQEDRADLARHLLVDVEARLDEHQLRAEPLGGRRRHGRAHAELARLVACRHHHAALAAAADRDRLAAQRRVVALLHRRIERIHVEMDDLAD
jgi:hypothetical protein